MSVESMAIALHHSRAKGTAKIIILGIANHLGDGGAWPSMETLAKYGNCNIRNARAAVAKLEELGEIARHVGAGGNHLTADYKRPNLYEFKLKCPSTCDGTTNHRTRGEVTFDMAKIDPRSIPTPPVDPDRGPRSQATAEPSSKPTTRDRENAYVSNRARPEQNDASGDSHQPADATPAPDFEPCPKGKGFRPHSYAPATGRCIDCGAHAPALTEGATA